MIKTMVTPRTASTLFLATAVLGSILAAPLAAQVATGIKAFNSYGGGPFDTVNLGNLNVHFAIPVLHKPGRGVPLTYDFTYDSSIWTPAVVGGVTTWQPTTNWGWGDTLWGGNSGYITWQSQGGQCYTLEYVNGQWVNEATGGWSNYTNWQYVDNRGAVHSFPNVQWSFSGGSCGTVNNNSYQPTAASDNSGLTLYAGSCGQPGPSGQSVCVQDASGLLYFPPINPSGTPVQAYNVGPDSNGNQITSTATTGTNPTLKVTDTLGQLVLTVAGSNPVTYTYTAPNATSVHYSVYYTSYNVKTNFSCGSVHEYTSTGAVQLVTSIAFPDDTFANPHRYTFNYEPTPGFSGYVTGRLASVTLPTGGTISYSYTGSNNGISCADGSAAGLNRQLSSPGGLWQYSRVQDQNVTNHWTTTVTSPTGDTTVIDFMKDGMAGVTATNSFFETQRVANQMISGAETPLLTTSACWNGAAPPCTTAAVNSPISQHAVTVQYPSSGLQSKTVTSFNSSGLVTERDTYAYSAGVPTTIAQKTSISYALPGFGIVNRPASVSVYDGSGNLLSRTTLNYDESAYPLQTPSATTPQHIAMSSSRGNATTISTAVSWNPTNQTVGSWLTRHFQYYDTGNVYRSQDVNGQWTTYNYSTAPQTITTPPQGTTTQSCGNSFPTSYTLPITGLSSLASTTYDCVGGVVKFATDVNGNLTTTNYSDAFYWRPASVVAPYTSNTSTTTTTLTYTASTLDTQMAFNGGTSAVEALTTFGNFGQALYSQQREGPGSGSWDSTQVIYDSLLRTYQSTMPCVTSLGIGCPSAARATKTFDALGRVTQVTDGGNPTPGWVKYTYTQNDVLQEVGPAPSGENTKQKQLEYDSLGRLVSVCEKSPGLPGYGVCSGMQGSPNGYLTTYGYGTTTINSLLYTTVTVTQNAQASSGQQTRVYIYDLAGRLVSEQNPENGTKTYVYDSDPSGTCSGTYTGDLVRVTDAKNNNICYQYDAIHRNTQITYPSGPDAPNTSAKTFVYDGATFNGTAMKNPEGRLVEAYTGSSGAKTTDEFFSYSARGELVDTWQCTPHSGTNGCASVNNYYHVTAGFWENGALKSLSSSISGLPSQTYGVDPMGRPNAVTASSGQNPVTSTSFSLSAFTTSVTFGSGDSDTFYFDQYTGRQIKYVFNVNGASDTGQTTWNPNGSLGSFQIIDTISGTSDTQTCSYTHDDLARISSVGCANGSTNEWNQNFTYDAFGNIQKAVPVNGTGISFQATYSASTNWITTLPGANPQTDANGQMTNDGAHSYSWDAGGKLYTVDSAPLVHDALGRMVETAASGGYTQIVYGPTGRFATMNGQALVKAFIPLPAGATAVYTSSGLAYYRHSDHLGSSRLATTPSRTLYSSTAYAPYGEPYAQAGTTDLSFTGQDADTIPDTTNGIIPAMYDFLYRKSSPVQGRWLSPDPAGLTAVDPSSPQTWNRYAYVMNNPMANIDPLGLCVLGGALPCLSGGHGIPHPHSPNSSAEDNGGDDAAGMTCIMDGVESPCSMVESALDNGNAAICPPGGGICSYGRNGGVYQYQNTGDDGMAWVRVDAIDVINAQHLFFNSALQLAVRWLKTNMYTLEGICAFAVDQALDEAGSEASLLGFVQNLQNAKPVFTGKPGYFSPADVVPGQNTVELNNSFFTETQSGAAATLIGEGFHLPSNGFTYDGETFQMSDQYLAVQLGLLNEQQAQDPNDPHAASKAFHGYISGVCQ